MQCPKCEVEKALGPDHPDEAIALENYAALLRETGGSAQALRRSVLALMDDPENEHFAHPLFWLFWAPFVVVGEGGAIRR